MNFILIHITSILNNIIIGMNLAKYDCGNSRTNHMISSTKTAKTRRNIKRNGGAI